MRNEMLVIKSSDLSVAWGHAMLGLMEKGVEELVPLVVNIELQKGEARETNDIRLCLDRALEAKDLPLCATTANTIFPQTFWAPGVDRQKLYVRYKQLLERLKKYPANRNGLYFERMIAHGKDEFNQLEHIITTWEGGNHRRSALQASIFDPSKDHTDQRRRGFPCLQQVAFYVNDHGLTVSAYYPVQNIFDRAYGNYLGLCRLGRFMAHEMGLECVQMQCMTGIAKIGNAGKNDLTELANTLRPLVQANPQSVFTNGQIPHEISTSANGAATLQATEIIHVGAR